MPTLKFEALQRGPTALAFYGGLLWWHNEAVAFYDGVGSWSDAMYTCRHTIGTSPD